METERPSQTHAPSQAKPDTISRATEQLPATEIDPHVLAAYAEWLQTRGKDRS